MEFVNGGICAAKGYKASGVYCGLRKNKTKKDLALIVSEKRAAAAAVYTQNLVKGAPIAVTKKNISDGYASAVICNSGNANTCNADGVEIAEKMCGFVEKYAGIPSGDVIIASTGVIGQPLNVHAIESGMPELVKNLAQDGSEHAATAIMTTDTVLKEYAVKFSLSGKECFIGGIAKGSGMIHPNMATMLCFLTTDAAISPAMLSKALSDTVKDTFNMISIDGDTSTNDMVSILANGMAGNEEITCPDEGLCEFEKALNLLMVKLCRTIAKDGEGATKLLECAVTGALDEKNAKLIAKSVICSSLFKAAMFGADANWGRVLCAIGYSGAETDVTKISVSFVSRAGEITVCVNGSGIDFSEEDAKKILSEDEITVKAMLGDGNASAVAWGCDLTYDYVKINGDYRT
ncbi:MAG: bifunctional glutamate N-acetyltransferase/amino-acid acetyltransferase ArgJ [Clostridiales bacterium]|nr:bifunctional glutamate N-acetyltransferase/amino-acid acetyltransferase ArgJ [Clostridiales bacterium]